MTTRQNWNSSEYVSTGTASSQWRRPEAPPPDWRGTNRLPYTGSATDSIPHISTKSNRKPPPDCHPGAAGAKDPDDQSRPLCACIVPQKRRGRKRKGAAYGEKISGGSRTIRKKTVTRKGTDYTYWKARYSCGFDPGTGKQIQRSITGKTQKEVAEKLREATAAIDAGTYTAPSKMTLGEWLDIWAADYLGGVKPSTVTAYALNIRRYIRPALGAVKLDTLNAHG